VCCCRFGNLWVNHLGSHQTSEFNIMKFHLVAHIPEFIKSFGHPMNYDTGSFESAHRFNVKGIFRLTNKSQDAAYQMLRHLSNIETCNVLSYLYDKQINAVSSVSDGEIDGVDDIEMEIARELVHDVNGDEEKSDDEDDNQIIDGCDEQRAFIVTTLATRDKADDVMKQLLAISGVQKHSEVTITFVFNNQCSDDEICVIDMMS